VVLARLECGSQALVGVVREVTDEGLADEDPDARFSAGAVDQPQGRYGRLRWSRAQKLKEELVGTVYRCHFQRPSPV
jgi:hypothetical protein